MSRPDLQPVRRGGRRRDRSAAARRGSGPLAAALKHTRQEA